MLHPATPLACVLLLVIASAGCLSPEVVDAGSGAGGPDGIDESGLSQPVHEGMLREPGWVTSTLDGARLYYEVFRPVTDEPVPVILVLSPYGGNLYLRTPPGSEEIVPRIPLGSFVRHFVPRGYAFALADVRGTGNSEGCMNLLGAKEQADAVDVVEHLAREPWSSGKVGMVGASYDGSTPLLAATQNPEGLVTVVPVAGLRSVYHGAYMGGVPYDGFALAPVVYGAYAAVPPTNVGDGAAWATQVAGAFCDQADEWSGSMAPGSWEKGIYTDYWRERDSTPRIPDVRASVFYVQGFNDANVKPDHVVDYFNAIESPKKAWLGQWAHEWPGSSMVPGAARDDWMLTLHAWFDHWLKGIANGIMDTPAVEVIDNENRIRYADAWPPMDADAVVLHLENAEGIGRLVTEAPPTESRASYAVRPGSDHVAELRDDLRYAGLDTAALAPATDGTVLRYVGEPVEEDLRIAGAARVLLRVATTAENTHVIVRLHEVDEDGAWREVSHGAWSLLLRDGLDAPNPVTSGEEYDVVVPLQPKEHVVKAGRRIALEVTGSDWRFAVLEANVGTTTLVTGGDAGGALTLPVLRDVETFER